MAVSLVSPKDEQFLDNIETLIGRRFERIIYPGYEMSLSAGDTDNATGDVLKKSRYKATQERNQMLARKKAENTPAAIRRAKAKKRKPR